MAELHGGTCYQSPSATGDFRPTRFVPIDGLIPEKLALLESFQSQSDRTYLEPELVTANARYWTRNLAPRVRYAEPFEVMRQLGEIFPSSGKRNANVLAAVPEQHRLAVGTPRVDLPA